MQIHNPPGGHPLALRIWNTAQQMGRAFDAGLAAEGSTRHQFFVFVALDRLVAPNQRELAEVVGVDDATITYHLAAMEREGLVVRTRDVADRRVVRVGMSESGRALWWRLVAAVDEYNGVQLAGMDPAELELLGTILDRLEANALMADAARAAK